LRDVDDPRFVIGGYANPSKGERILHSFASFIPSAAPVFEVEFDDISKWNGPVNFQTMRQFVQMVIIRAGYGDAGIDPLCEQNVAGARAVGLEYSLYWFLMPRNNTNWQVTLDSFSKVWEKYKGRVYPVFDHEYTELGKVDTTKWMYNLKDGFIKETGVKPILYSRKNWIETYTTQPAWLADLFLWVAQYNQYIAAPAVPLPWKTWWGWQWSADGNGMGPAHGGASSSMDRNRCNMTIAQFNETFGTNIRPIGEVPPDDIEEEINPIKIATVTADLLNVRSSPPGTGAGYKDIGNLYRGCSVPVVEERGDWYRIEGWIHKGYTK